MTVAVLNPRDSLVENRFNTRFSNQALISPEMKCTRNANPGFNRSNRMQTNRRKRSPPPRPHNTSPPSRAASGPTKVPVKSNLVMGQVKILKRGEELATSTVSFQAPDMGKKVIEKREDPDLGSTERLGPDPGLVPTQIRLTESKNRVASFYAGSAFITSPPPSSLPLPAFFTKKGVTVKTDDATSDLRRILKLDLF